MGELRGDSTFVLGLRVDEEGDLRFALGADLIEIRFADDGQPAALREVSAAQVERPELAPWQEWAGPE